MSSLFCSLICFFSACSQHGLSTDTSLCIKMVSKSSYVSRMCTRPSIELHLPLLYFWLSVFTTQNHQFSEGEATGDCLQTDFVSTLGTSQDGYCLEPKALSFLWDYFLKLRFLLPKGSTLFIANKCNHYQRIYPNLELDSLFFFKYICWL